MILAASSFLFLATFFLTLSFPLVRPIEKQIGARLKRRLHETDELRQAVIHLERKDRLSDLPVLDKILRHFHWLRSFQLYIQQAALPISTGALILISLVLGLTSFLLARVFSIEWLVGTLLVSGTAVLPFGYVAFRRGQRFKKFAEAFPDAISRMASSLRAGYSAQMAFEALIADSSTIVSEEFKHVVAQMEVGQSFEDSLKKMLERIDTPELRLFISSVLLQRESGGNLAILLDNLESTIRARFELQRELGAASAQGKLSGMVLSFLPLFVGVFVFMIHREYTLFFFQDPVGKQLLALSITGQVMGMWTIRKLVRIDL